MARRKNGAPAEAAFDDYRHDTKRKNNPPASIAAEGKIPAAPKLIYSYSPRLDPKLRFDDTGGADRLPELLKTARTRALTADEAQILAEALRTHQPWLEWAGKRESKSFSVDPVALYIHERVSTEALLRVAARQDVTRDLFADPQQEYRQAVQFYQHDVDWSNRLILGDSLQVMASLAQREDLAGKVQMIYIDPPYGIKFGSNFQTSVGDRDVKDKERDLTREMEMVKAYRDTWTMGVHSYIAYLRDRTIASRSLLADSGSVFVQISDENLHRVRVLLDEIFGLSNFVSQINVKKTSGSTADYIPNSCDYVLWYAKNKNNMRFSRLYLPKEVGAEGATGYTKIEYRNGERRSLTEAQITTPSLIPTDATIFAGDNVTSQSIGREKGEGAASWFAITVDGTKFDPGPKARWKTNEDGMRRLLRAGRLIGGNRTTLSYKRDFDDFSVTPLSNIWTDTVGQNQFGGEKRYVVQTALKIVQRCMLLTTRPGDLVLDPTGGSGTTAYVAEQWGRRWISIDTSRVAIAIARQRLMTLQLDYYELRDGRQGLRGGFVSKTVPHVTLKSIAQNTNLDPILAGHEPLLEAALASLRQALGDVGRDLRQKLAGKLAAKQRAEGKRAITDADKRRWILPKEGQQFEHWTVPFDTDPDYPQALAEAVTAYRTAWRTKMDEVNACIAANAEPEELVDQPKVVRGIIRVAGPFTVEAVQPPEMSLGVTETPIGGEPEELETGFEPDGTGEVAAQNAEAYLDEMLRLIRSDGVRFTGNRQMEFTRLEPITGRSGAIHAEGRWHPKDESDPDPEGPPTVCVAFGPQYGPVTARQVEMLLRAASRRGYDDLVIAGFTFDGAAQAAIEDAEHPNVRIHMAHIRPDVNPGMNGLLKEQPGSQLFTVFGQPRTRLDGPDGNGEYTVVMEGVDIYNPVDNSVTPTRADKVAAWFLDGDYDGRTFCITQAFFPDRDAWEKLAEALKGVIDEERFATLSGTISLPFPAGPNRAVAVKVIDPRGNEVMRLHRLENGHGG